MKTTQVWEYPYCSGQSTSAEIMTRVMLPQKRPKQPTAILPSSPTWTREEILNSILSPHSIRSYHPGLSTNPESLRHSETP